MYFWLDIFNAAMLGGLIFLDSAAVAQIMVSQPIVCAPLLGWFLGDWQSGLLIGALLELLWIGKLPIGSHVPPEAPISAITATIIYISFIQNAVGPIGSLALAAALVCGIINGWIGGALTIAIRKFNNRFNRMADRAAERGMFHEIDTINFISILLIWSTATILIFIGTIIPVSIFVVGIPSVIRLNLLQYTVLLLVAIGIAVILDLFQLPNRKRYFLIGLSAGLILTVVYTYLFKI
ncbi:MAG: PTS sugar transporter subunit IIC [bacterium]|nr:PTS sugar transporter subunit IIC [bacterium]